MGRSQRFEIHVATDSEPEPVHMLGGSPKTHPEVQRVLDWVSEIARGRVANMHPSVRNPHAISFTAWRDGAESIAALVEAFPGVTVKDMEGNVVEASTATREAFTRITVIGTTNAAAPTGGHVDPEDDNPWEQELFETGVID